MEYLIQLQHLLIKYSSFYTTITNFIFINDLYGKY